MQNAPVLFDKRGNVAYVTLNRPQVRNALDTETHAQLGRIWDAVEADDEVWVVVLTGAGDRAFSAGMDLKEMTRLVAAGVRPSSLGSLGAPGYPRLTERFAFAKPLIARVNGAALGGGFELALACDIVVAAEHAVFALPEARLGLVAGAGGVIRLSRQAPLRVALGHLLTGRSMSAQEAWRLGLVNDVVPMNDLDDCVEGWVSDILRCSPVAVRAAKEVAHRAYGRPLAEAFAAAYEWERCRMGSPDAVEGMTAFVEKRPPRWSRPPASP